MNLVRSAWGWLRQQIVADVPEGDAICEFDCRKLQCHVGEWEVCERRLQKTAGELMPSQEPGFRPDSPKKTVGAPGSESPLKDS